MEEAIARGWVNLSARLDGPMLFRLIVQPAVAIFLAVLAGIRDARAGRPPFLWSFFSTRSETGARLRDAWSGIRRVFLLALAMDAIYQVTEHHGIYLLELLTTAVILALLPYIFTRGLATRLTRAYDRARATDARDVPRRLT